MLSKLSGFTSFRRKFIPDYAVLPLVMLGVGQLICYYVSRFLLHVVFRSCLVYHDISLTFEKDIPTVPAFIIIYFLSFVFWAVSYIAVAHYNKKEFYRLITAEMTAKLICFIVFMAFPCTIVRPETIPNAPFDWLLNLLWITDIPDNIFPSMHCLFSWFALRYVCRIKEIRLPIKLLSAFYTVLVFFSVLFTKQHVIADIVGGILLAEVMIFVSDRIKSEKILGKLDIEKYLSPIAEADSGKR